jgi:16S rRNA (cytosine1402-N4)-methyltransferase
LLLRYPEAELIGLDRDTRALAEASRRLTPFGARARLTHADLGDMEKTLDAVGGGPVVGILLDLGVSSMQLDDPRRGFSYSADGPLHMGLDGESGHGVAGMLANMEEGELKRVFRELGELPAAGRAARAVLGARDRAGMSSTGELVNALRSAGFTSPRRLSQAFQALRLAVNDELGSLRRGLAAAARLLPPGGTLTVISFESLMDRMVKQTLRPLRDRRPLPGEPDPTPIWSVLTKRVVRPRPEEVERNPRARSARLRAAARTAYA